MYQQKYNLVAKDGETSFVVVSGRNLVQYVNGSHLLYQWHAMSACLNFFFQGEGMVMLSEEYFGSFFE